MKPARRLRIIVWDEYTTLVRAIVLRALLGLVVVAIVWLFAGRRISMLLDRFGTLRLRTLPVSPFSCSPGTIWFSDIALSFAEGPETEDDAVDCDSSGRVVVTISGRPFALGARGARGGAGFEFAPDPGDQVSLVVDRSLLSWPTPFDFNFMTGHSPSWKRHLYYRLRWSKASGANLTTVWRYEQYFYDSDGWTDGFMTRAGSTGLIEAHISS
jgi:hypothetical protein